MSKSLGDITTIFSRVTGRNNDNDIPDSMKHQYISDFYTLIMPQELKLYDAFSWLKFNTVVGQEEYLEGTAFNLNVIQGSNSYANLISPVYIDNLEGGLYKDPTTFLATYGNAVDSADFKDQATGTVNDGAAQSFTVSSSPIITGSVTVTDGTELFLDNGLGVLTGGDGGVGTVDYITGAITVTFAAASGAAITVSYSQIETGQPEVLLFYDNKIIMRPVPNDVYAIKIAAYITPQFDIAEGVFLASSTIFSDYWFRYIAYGAAIDFFSDFGEFEKVNEISPIFARYRGIVKSRTTGQLKDQRSRPSF